MPTPVLPEPAQNRTSAGLRDQATDLATSSTVRVALGDFTGGAAENLFTLTAHGLATGDVVHVLWQSAMGAALGGEGTRYYVKVLTSSTFQLATDKAVASLVTNTADGTVVFLSGDISTETVESGIIP